MPKPSTVRRHSLLVCFLAVLATTVANCNKVTKEQYVANGDSLAKEGKYPEAILEYRRALQLDNGFVPAHRQLAEAYLQTDNAQGAIRELVSTADLAPKDVAAQVKAGDMLLLLQRWEDAATRAEKALKI